MIYLRGNRARLRRAGRPTAATAGATTRCSRTSSAARTTSAARAPTTASAARSGCLRQPLDAPAGRHDARGRRPGRARGEPRPERRAPGRRRPLPAHAARRPALQHRGRVPAPGGRPPEPRGDRLRLRPADRLRGRPRGGRRGRPQRRARDGPRRARGDPLRRLPTSRRCCSCSRGSAPPRSWPRSGSRCARTCRSAGTSRITSWRSSTT